MRPKRRRGQAEGTNKTTTKSGQADNACSSCKAWDRSWLCPCDSRSKPDGRDRSCGLGAKPESGGGEANRHALVGIKTGAVFSAGKRATGEGGGTGRPSG